MPRKSKNSVIDDDVDLAQVMDEEETTEEEESQEEQQTEVIGDNPHLPSTTPSESSEDYFNRILEKAKQGEMASLIENNNNEELTDVDRMRIIEKSTTIDLLAARQIMLDGMPMATAADRLKMFKDFAGLKKDALVVSQARAKAQLDNFDLVRGNLVDSTIRAVAGALDETMTDLELEEELRENIMNKLEEKLQGEKVKLVEG